MTIGIRKDDPNQRGMLAAVATGTALFGGVAKGMVIDRPRLLAAFPHARAEHKLGKWGAELLQGSVTNDIVPIEGGTLRALGRTLTTQGWKHSYQASNGIALALLGVTMVYGIPNTIDGIIKGGGPQGLTQNRPGRTGMFAIGAGIFDATIMTKALRRAPAGNGRLLAALQDPIHSGGKVVLARVALGIPVLLNELGYLDFLNADDGRDAITVARDTTAGHVQQARDLLPFI